MQPIVASPIIPVLPSQIGAETIQTVNARDLHAFLEVQSEFRSWIKNRIEQYGFTQDVDFVAGKFLPGSKRIDYHLSLDMAKELSMVERNEKGKEARRYFIECERQAKAKPMSPAEVLIHQGQLMLAIEQEQARLAKQVEVLQEQAEANAKQIQQIETASDHFTIIGWFRYAKLGGSLPLAEAAKMGKQATMFCQENEIVMGEVPDPRFGVVPTYPKWVLDSLFVETH